MKKLENKTQETPGTLSLDLRKQPSYSPSHQKQCLINAGKITFWGEMERRNLLPYGNPEEIYRSAAEMKNSIAGVDVPLESIKAILTCCNR